jgi:hypothetical protein
MKMISFFVFSRDNYEQMKSDAKHLQSEFDRMITHRPAKVNQMRENLFEMRIIIF